MRIFHKVMFLMNACVFAWGVVYAVSVSFDASKIGSTLAPRTLIGTCLPIWNDSNVYRNIKKGLSQSSYTLLRFPNGSLSNGYHWNRSGAYTVDSVWVCDSQTYRPGFLGKTLFRGTSVYNYGFSGYSNITDGDTASQWRSAETDSGISPYFYLELPQSSIVDSIRIMWGDRYAVDFDVDFFSSPGCPYPGPFKYRDDFWVNQNRVTGNDQKQYAASLPTTITPKWVRVIVRKFKADEKTVEVKEVYLYSKGKQISVNTKKYTGGGSADQTRVIAMPTFEGSNPRPDGANWTTWHFESYMTYLRAMGDSAVSLICVNFGTGTPQEAAAWVYYANIVKNYNIKFWQVGNEMDGEWEDGGPVTAAMYAEKFIRFAKAMKQVDSTIKVLGPLLSNADFNVLNSGVFDKKSWMQSFLSSVGEREKADNRKYCDGVDFHSYPYWAASPNASDMMKKVDYAFDQSDSLVAWIHAYCALPDSVMVNLSEYNSSVVTSDLLQRPCNGIFTANMFAGHAQKFGSRAMSVFWDSYEAASSSSQTYGSLSLFNDLPNTMWSSLVKAPSAAYWALYCAQNLWIDPAKENSLVQAVFNRADGIRAYGIKTGADFRVMAFNVSFSPETLTCTLTNATYAKADVFMWGERQFLWNGADKNAFAFPNCGPSSYCVNAADVSPIILPAQSLCVVRFHDSVAAAPTLAFTHFSVYLPGNSTMLLACGSAYRENSVITGIDYAFDTNSAAPLHSRDAGYDGPFESFFDSLSLAGLKAGPHKLYVWARSGSQVVARDSVTFGLNSNIQIKFSNAKNNVTHYTILQQRTAAGIRLTLSGHLPAGLRAQVVSLNGKCVRDLAVITRQGRATVQLTGTDASGPAISQGVYMVVLKSADAIIYKQPMVIGR